MRRVTFVLDACVMVDMLSADRPRHDEALQLECALLAKKVLCIAPATVLVEVYAASSQASKAKGAPLVFGRPKENVWPFDLFIIPIDMNFVAKYVVPLTKFPLDLPRGGDLPYFYLAMKNDAPLITEDVPLRRIADRWGVKAMNISEAILALED